MDLTKVYEKEVFQNAYIRTILKEVIASLKKRGYNPINQIAGYLMSGDPGYITNYEDARRKIICLDRAKILEVLVEEMVNQ